MKNNCIEKKKVGLFTHKSADYDALGSTLTLASYLNSLGNIDVFPVIENSYLLEKINNSLRIYKIDEVSDICFDYAIVCDVNEQDRLYGLDLVYRVPMERRYVIDHHDQNRKEIETLDNHKIVLPSYAATCEIITELLAKRGYEIPKENSYDLYRGMASDTFGFKRNITFHTKKMVEILRLSEEDKSNILNNMNALNTRQEELYNKISFLLSDGDLKVYGLFEKDEEDITQLIKHEKFDAKVGPTKKNPVTFFIIGCGNNYFIKFKKLSDYDLDLLAIASNCNGGGHVNRCAGRFYNTSYDVVFKKIIEEYEKVRIDSKRTDVKKLIRH